MSKIKHILFPTSMRILSFRLGILLLSLQICRILFYIFNRSNFTEIGLQDWIASIYFDLVTIALIGIPFIFLELVQGIIQNNTLKKLEITLFHITHFALIAFNLMDIVYFSYTSKRSTLDLFSMLAAGNDFSQQLGSFFKDFWFLLIFATVLIILVHILYKKTENITQENTSFKLHKLLSPLLFAVLVVIMGRGGFSLKPVSPIDAAQMTRIENAGLVLNTAFTLLKSYNKSSLEEKKYFDKETELKLFNPIKISKPQGILPENTNVVIIILESFGNEWVGAAGAEKSFTPFLDSLIEQSWYFKNGIANGKKSIEAVPAIIASIPSLSDNPYISSPYADNRIFALPSILKEAGYESAFFHGATNGSMRFDAFSKQAGYDSYLGRREYNNETHADPAWGILDEYFNPWTAKQLSNMKKPFLGTLFTLSSHHPYYIPEHLKGKLLKGPQQICESIHYGDYSLEKFFKEAKKQDWYENTLFILCADHTSATVNPVYNQRTEMFKIPIVFFHPKGYLPKRKEERIFQQLDIMPTVLDLLNIKKSYYAYGNSYYDSIEPEAVNFLEGSYSYFRNKHLLTFSNEKARNLYSILVQNKVTQDSISFYKKESLLYEKRLKALIQRYNRDLIRNQTVVE
jgi:phosphoglycerol transferase MdoB-like AlkP superfamily enzyme